MQDDPYAEIVFPPVEEKLGWSLAINLENGDQYGWPLSKNGNPYHPQAHVKGMIGTYRKAGSTDEEITKAKKAQAQQARQAREKALRTLKGSKTAIEQAQRQMVARALRKVSNRADALNRLERCAEVLEQIMDNDEVDAKTRIIAVQTYWDRILGKPKQEVHHEGASTTFLQVLHQAQELNRDRSARRTVDNEALDAGDDRAGHGPEVVADSEPVDRGAAALPAGPIPRSLERQDDPEVARGEHRVADRDAD